MNVGRTTRAPASLTRFALLSVALALVTIALKTGAYLLTGSVGLLSDALESGVNLLAGVIAFFALKLAERPPDQEHAFGQSKAEYFSSGAEGALILVAAIGIVASAIVRLRHPRELEAVGLGLGVTVAASVLNLIVARILLRVGRERGSITLEADAHHLMTDVWTSAGVVVGVAMVALTGWQRFDPLVAIAVALHIMRMGWNLVQRSLGGLLDRALPRREIASMETALDSFGPEHVKWHALKTRQAGARRFVEVHLLVPGAWTVQRGHDTVERVEARLRACAPMTTVVTHLEPVEDARAWNDEGLDRDDHAHESRRAR